MFALYQVPFESGRIVDFRVFRSSFPYVVFNQPMLSRNKVNHTEVQLGLQ